MQYKHYLQLINIIAVADLVIIYLLYLVKPFSKIKMYWLQYQRNYKNIKEKLMMKWEKDFFSCFN